MSRLEQGVSKQRFEATSRSRSGRLSAGIATPCLEIFSAGELDFILMLDQPTLMTLMNTGASK
jgi:hypothetical protein